MSDNLFVFTETLPLPDAKKLLATLQKPSKSGSWQDWSGEDGFITEVKLGPVCGSVVEKIHLPSFVVGIFISVDEQKLNHPNAIPDSLFLGGDDWVIPGHDCHSAVRFEIVEPELVYPMRYGYEKRTNMRFFGRKNNVSDRLTIIPCFEFRAPDHALPPRETVDLIAKKMQDRFQTPGMTDQGFLESYSTWAGGFEYDFDPEKSNWLRVNFRKMVEKLVKETPADSFKICVHLDIGGTARFHGESRNVREDAQELLRRIPEKNAYSTYDITYYVVGPQDWKGHEKSRKKWKKPIHQEIGTMTLEDGVSATVKLRIEKEGYVFTLDFEDVDGLAAFRETKLFQKTHWNLGAE